MLDAACIALLDWPAVGSSATKGRGRLAYLKTAKSVTLPKGLTSSAPSGTSTPAGDELPAFGSGFAYMKTNHSRGAHCHCIAPTPGYSVPN